MRFRAGSRVWPFPALLRKRRYGVGARPAGSDTAVALVFPKKPQALLSHCMRFSVRPPAASLRSMFIVPFQPPHVQRGVVLRDRALFGQFEVGLQSLSAKVWARLPPV